MNIRQLQVRYDPLEDRLLTRINTRDGIEIRFWLTRRLMQRLWPELLRAGKHQASQTLVRGSAKATLLPETRDAALSMARASALAQGDFATAFDDQASTLPLGDQPLLISRIKLSFDSQGEVRLDLSPDDERVIGMILQPALLHAFCELLCREAAKSGWDLNLQLEDANSGDGLARQAMN